MTLKHVIMASATAMTVFGVSAVPAAAEPVVIRQVAPEYPRGAERRSLEGTVDLAFEVNENGRVSSVEVLDATMPGVFDNAAIEALEQWRFEENNPGRGEISIAFQL